MNKAQLIDAVGEVLGVSRRQATAAVDAVLDTIVRNVVEGDDVRVTGFGTFSRKHRDARVSRNPQTGDSVQVPEQYVPRFAAGQQFKDLVDYRVPLPETGRVVRKAAKGSKTAPF